jgi:hypothetical protein
MFFLQPGCPINKGLIRLFSGFQAGHAEIGRRMTAKIPKEECDMKKWFVLALIVCVAAAVQAGEGEGKKKGKGQGKELTKEEYVAQQKKMSEKKGTEFDQAKVESRFDKMDKNDDGKLTPDEKGKGKGKKKKGEKKPE